MRQNFINKDYEVRILKNTTKGTTHTDASIPQVPKKAGADGTIGKFYQLALFKKKTAEKKFQAGRAIKFNVFNTGIREGVFQDIETELSNPANFTKQANGDVVLNTMSAAGNTVCEKTGFPYEIIFPDGRKLIREDVRLFVFDFEAEGDDDQVLIASEIRRARASIVQATADGEGTNQMES